MAEQAASEQVVATQKVAIKLRGPDLNPPIYVAGSFTEEPWSPVEMDVEGSDWENGKMIATTFYKAFDLVPGEYHYKFRLGDGDWWICDEDQEIVKDDSGNSNNRLVVLPVKNDEGSGTSTNGTARIFSQEVYASNYWLPPIIAPQLDASSEHDDTVADDKIPRLTFENALGTWQPDQGLLSGYRRASTSLGVRISRMGTFIMPTDEEVKEPEGLTEERLKACNIGQFPNKREDVIAKVEEKADNAEGDNSIASLDGSCDVPTGRVQTAGTNHMKPRIKGEGRRRFVSSLDSIMEVPQETDPIGGYLGTGQNGASSSGVSYGTMTTESLKNTIGEQQHVPALDEVHHALRARTPFVEQQHAPPPLNEIHPALRGQPYFAEQQHVPPPLDEIHPALRAPAYFVEPTYTYLTADGQASDRLSESITENKGDEKDVSKDAPKGFSLLATVAAWFRGLWKRLFGGLKKKEQDRKAKDSAQN